MKRILCLFLSMFLSIIVNKPFIINKINSKKVYKRELIKN